jgi:hypothetical protein
MVEATAKAIHSNLLAKVTPTYDIGKITKPFISLRINKGPKTSMKNWLP